jgi:hypothetical protein
MMGDVPLRTRVHRESPAWAFFPRIWVWWVQVRVPQGWDPVGAWGRTLTRRGAERRAMREMETTSERMGAA